MAIKTDKTQRLAAYVLAEDRGRIYPEREAEQAWVRANLPATRDEFIAVVMLVEEAYGVGVDQIRVVASPLVGCKKTWTKKDGDGFPAHEHSATTEAWGFPTIKPRARRAQRRVCAICGGFATSRANSGWACSSHYDALS